MSILDKNDYFYGLLLYFEVESECGQLICGRTAVTHHKVAGGYKGAEKQGTTLSMRKQHLLAKMGPNLGNIISLGSFKLC